MHAGCGYTYRHTSSSQSCKQSLILERMYSTMTQEEYRVLQVTCRGEKSNRRGHAHLSSTTESRWKKCLLLSNKVERFAVNSLLYSLCFDCKGQASLSKSSVQDTTGVSFWQLFLWDEINGHGFVNLMFSPPQVTCKTLYPDHFLQSSLTPLQLTID